MEEITIKDSLKITPMQVGGDGKTVQLILTGYLDTYNSPEFQTHVNQLIDSGINRIIFNCNGLNYISSTDIGAFTAFLKNLKQKKRPRRNKDGERTERKKFLSEVLSTEEKILPFL